MHKVYFVSDKGIDFLIECVRGRSRCEEILMERYVNAKDRGACRAFFFCGKIPTSLCLTTKVRGRTKGHGRVVYECLSFD